jgi:hypothetical protein
MRTARVTVTSILCIASLVACRPGTTSNPSEDTQAPRLSPSTAPEGTNLASDIPRDPTAQRMVTRAIEHLANRLGVEVERIALLDARPVQWRDAGLGCPKPGVDYIRMETPGYSVALELDGTVYEYHTNEVNRVILCRTR